MSNASLEEHPNLSQDIIETSLQKRLIVEKERLSKIFPTESRFEFSKETAYWYIQAVSESGSLEGGQTINCHVYSASPNSLSGGIGGFRILDLNMNGEQIYRETLEKVRLSVVPYEIDTDSLGEVSLPPHCYDPQSGEMFIFGLRTADDVLAVLHEYAHGQVNPKERRKLYDTYKKFESMVYPSYSSLQLFR